MHQIGNFVASTFSGIFAPFAVNQDPKQQLNTDAAGGILGGINALISGTTTATNTDNTTNSASSDGDRSSDSIKMRSMLKNEGNVINGLLSDLSFCSSMLLLSIYILVTFNSPGWMVHSAGLRKSTPDEITKHPRVVVSPHRCPTFLSRGIIAMSSCVFQYYFYQKQMWEDHIAQKQAQLNTPKMERDIHSHEQLTRLSLIIYSRMTGM